MTVKTIDNFIDHWKELRDYADGAQYTDVVNPVDGVVYPGICSDIPDYAEKQVRNKLADIFDGPVTIKTMFMRLSLKGTKAPHQAHTDSTMGSQSLMLYMNRQEHSQGGTSLVSHKATGLYTDQALTDHGQYIWDRDTNKYDAWSIYKMAWMQPNRGFIFPAHLMHRAEPAEGFGTNKKNGRLVLTAFFDI